MTKRSEALRDRARAQADDAAEELAMTMSELEDLLGTGSAGADAAMALQAVKPTEVARVIHALLVGNPFLLNEVLLGAGLFLTDVERHLKGMRGYRKEIKALKVVSKNVSIAVGESNSTDFEEALDTYDWIVSEDAAEDEEDDC